MKIIYCAFGKQIVHVLNVYIQVLELNMKGKKKTIHEL